MTSTNKVVFLIDTSIGIDSPDKSKQRVHSICLSCLRVLTFLSSKAEKAGKTNKSKISQRNVKWGYKFYSSSSVKTKVEFHKFYDFKLKYFEEFEHEVEKRFNRTTTVTTATASSSVAASVCLSKGLTEVLSDFPWEGPDITSPVKGNRSHKNIARSKNIIYLFSDCPRTSVQLKLFSGKKVLDGDVFLDSILPPSLYQEFTYTSKLTLNWIDTCCLPTHKKEQTVDQCSIQIVESAVAKAGGHVFPLDGIVQIGSPYYVDVESLLVVGMNPGSEVQPARHSVYSHSHILPVSTTLQHLQNTPADLTLSGFDTVLKIGGIVLYLDILPSERDPSHSRFHEPMEEEVNLLSVSATSAELVNTGVPSTLRAYSLLERASCYSLLPEKCYVGSETETSVTKKCQTNPGKKGRFRGLLSSLVSRSCSLILVCECTGQLTVLEPLTVDTACIYPLSKANTLALEKVLFSQSTHLSNNKMGTSVTSQPGDQLVKKLLAGKKCRPSNAVLNESVCDTRALDGKLMDRWHLPGPRSSFTSLIQKLNLRINELEFLNTDETNVLKQLQNAYKLEKKPPGVRDTSAIASLNMKEETKQEDKFELPLKGKPSRTSISRAEVILSKSKEVVKVRDISEKEGLEKSKPDREKPAVVAQPADFQNVDELKEFLTSTYKRAISGESTCVDVNAQTVVTVALHYLKLNGKENPEEECCSLLDECVVLSASTLRETYASSIDFSTEQKMAEYQFQIILRLEMLSTLISKDQTIGEEESNNEVVGMLRTLSFMCEPGALSKFMETCLLYNYMHTIPKTLANIYDELMQPLPSALSNILSPNNSSADQSVFNLTLIEGEGGPPSARTRSHGSVGPPSSQPGSNQSFTLDTSINKVRGGRKLVHHPSLAGFGGQRQIVVEKVPKPKEKSSRKRRRSGKEGKEIVVKSLFDKSRGGTKLERRQSVAVMQRTQRTPKKAAARLLFKSPVHDTRRKSLVAETPQRKQLAQSICQPDDVIDQSENTDIVKESPEKAFHGARKDTPTKGKRAKALMRRSFYSAGPIKRTRNLTQYFQLADRIAGRTRHPSNPTQNKLPKLLSFDANKQLKSPEKNSSFLLSQLVFSPSPKKCTPKKLNQTPSKLLMDSPSRNTRSRHQSGCSVPVNPFSLFSSPNQKNNLQQRVASPSNRLLQSPHSRRQSPRVLVQESASKKENISPDKTPKKSPYCAAISSGLDSPSESSHIRVSATPTRRSVRAALFSKSPAPGRVFSPRAVNASPKSLLSRFGSPRKQVTNDVLLSPKRQWKGLTDDATTGQGQSAGYRKTVNSMSIIDIEVAEHVPQTDEAKKESSDIHKKEVREGVQKTPSPHSKKTKTPESFDKWPRRKPRNQVSPAPNKDVSTTTYSHAKDIASPIKSSVYTSLEALSPHRKKRNLLLSPDRLIDSPSKRRRTSRLDSLSSLGTGSMLNSTMTKDGSQGFDVNSPLMLSQISNASSMDYFSAVNDEVFLSQSQTQSQSHLPLDVEDMEVDNIENVLLRKVKSKDKGASFLKKRTLETGQAERSESPIFLNSCRNSDRKRHVSKDKSIPIVENVESSHKPVCLANNSAGNSPKFGQSPSEKKYSPSVSAKSLMHLINSPLMNASNKNEARSRRSLRLQN